MGDQLDRAQQDMDFHLGVAIKNAKSAFANRELQVNGRCHYCDEYVEHPSALFCDSDCAQDWEKEQQARKRNGL
ncbi:hypothetical protein NVP1123O_52 [Vibrio phage 1.123.O._10N.286.48.F3]|nr:hypothetical protein NVP1123O_52 [Vibrio phage 1.123.O._10N.286.48.F3]